MPSQTGSPSGTTAGRGAFVFLLVGGLLFAGIGMLALVQGVRTEGSKNGVVAIVVGSVFLFIGLLMALGGWRGSVSVGRTNALIAANPDKPWMWREEWASGVIKDSNKAGAFGLWIFAILWNAISFPIAILAIRQMRDEPWPLLFVLLFPFIGVIVFISAIYSTLRAMKFGTSTCRLERLPIVPGRVFRGHIAVSSALADAAEYEVRIMCVRAVTSGSGKSRSTTEHLLWDQQMVVPSTQTMRSPAGTSIPFQFATPPDAHITDESNPSDRTFWRLSVGAELPGVDYSAQFEVPVFRTGEAVDPAEFEQFAQRQRAAAARIPVKATAGVEITRLPGGGEEFHMQAVRTAGGSIGSIAFLLAWNAAIAAMIYFGAPWGFPAVFIALDILFILASIDYFIGRSTITVDATGVRVNKRWLGAGSTKFFTADDIESIEGTAPAANSKSFAVMLKLRDQRPRQLGPYLTSRSNADAIAAKMLNDLGRG